jgi:uncharacterized protein YdhG (YjbR/CyaY superfamily)
MANKFHSIEDYIASFNGATKERLIEMRRTIQQTIPKATEGLHYNIPAYNLDGVWVAYFSGFSKHVSLALGGPLTAIVEEFSEDLKPYKTSTSAIQFQNSQPFPSALVKKLLKFRIAR